MGRKTIAMAVAALMGVASPVMGWQEPAVTVAMTAENTFEPKVVEVEAGQVVAWSNPSEVVHTATFDPQKAGNPSNVALPEGAEPFDSGDVEAGGTYRRTFDVPGTYRYVCLPHENLGMVGTVEVSEAGAAEESKASGESSGSTSEGEGSTPEEPKGFAANLASWLGKFHPPSINFPIALILSAVVAELLWTATGRPRFDHAARFCVWVGAIGAVVSVALGWCFAGLAWNDGDWMMTTHRWLGTSAGIGALLVLVLAEWSRRPSGRSIRPWYLAILFLAAVAVGLNGHYGGLMAYGPNHYAWPGSGG